MKFVIINTVKTTIHPKYNPSTQVVCSCGNMFTVGSTVDTIRTELCYKCHPFFTGQQKFVDTASRIDKFMKKVKAARPQIKNKKEEKKEDQTPLTLREMLQAIKR